MRRMQCNYISLSCVLEKRGCAGHTAPSLSRSHRQELMATSHGGLTAHIHPQHMARRREAVCQPSTLKPNPSADAKANRGERTLLGFPPPAPHGRRKAGSRGRARARGWLHVLLFCTPSLEASDYLQEFSLQLSKARASNAETRGSPNDVSKRPVHAERLLLVPKIG